MKIGKVLLVLLPLLALISPSLVNASTFDLKPPPAEALMAPPIFSSSPIYDMPLMLTLSVIGFAGGLIIWKKNTFKAVTVASLILLSGLIPIAFASYSFGEPLTTAGIGLMSYYEHTSFNLSNCASGFESYTDHGNYLDGVIRLYIDGSGNTYTGDDYNWLVNCRVRADGWILTWLNSTQENEYHLYDGIDSYMGSANTLTDYWTSLGRAMNRIFYAASEVFPGYDSLSYYDYSETSATKLVFGQWSWFTNSWETDRNIGAFTVPSTRTIEKAILILHCLVPSTGTKTYKLDGDTIASGTNVPTGSTDWLESYDIAAYIDYDQQNNLLFTIPSGINQFYNVIVVLWLS